MEEDGDQPLFQGLLRDEPDLLLECSLYLLVERLDPVVRVYEAPEALWELIERQHVLGLLGPEPEFRVFPLPFGGEIPQGLLPGLRAVLFGYGHEAVGHLGSVRRPDLGACVPEEAD